MSREPYYSDSWLTVYGGDCREVMRSMEPESVHCVVTSPPYFALRDYGVEGQIGLEPDVHGYVESLVGVFREVRRVLRDDGTVWLNLGDSYAGVGAQTGGTNSKEHGRRADRMFSNGYRSLPDGVKPKDLYGVPWRVAFALQADGWYLRSDIIWSKPNPMPESVTDRPTKSHEYLFLLSKSPRYYFDADAVREAHSDTGGGFQARRARGETSPAGANGMKGGKYGDGEHALPMPINPAGRNLRSVWTIATQPYPGAHYAVFPRKLVEPCIKAGTSEKGVCPECGLPWRRVTEETLDFTSGSGRAGREPDGKNGHDYEQATSGSYDIRMGPSKSVRTLSWIRSCEHDVEPIPATVLDPFAGSGTTGMIAQSLGRRAVLIDLNPDYLAQAMKRNRDIPLGLSA